MIVQVPVVLNCNELFPATNLGHALFVNDAIKLVEVVPVIVFKREFIVIVSPATHEFISKIRLLSLVLVHLNDVPIGTIISVGP